MTNMTTKEKILCLLEKNRGCYISGEEIANDISVSRTAVWKAVKALKQEGYEIISSTNKGYCLADSTDILSREIVERELNVDNLEIEVFSVIDSTNTYIKQRAEEGAVEGLCAIAGEQTGGKGRRGRSFYSPKDSGVYFSLLLRPKDYDASMAADITTMAAVALCEAVREMSGREPGIKWVNDVFLDGKKICGILTEASFDLETSYCDYAVLGVGVNVYYPEGGFAEDIKDIAGVVFTERGNNKRARLAACFLNRFMFYYHHKNRDLYKDSYRKLCFILGKQINVIKANKTRIAKAIDLDKDCHLIVEYKDGSREVLNSGEVSVRISD